jgi:hypothetical protein
LLAGSPTPPPASEGEPEEEPFVFGGAVFFGDPDAFVVRVRVLVVRAIAVFGRVAAGADRGSTAKAGTAS